MNRLNSVVERKRYLFLLLVSVLLVVSCTKKPLEVQQDFPFEVNVMPVPKAIAHRETVEIRLEIIPSSSYKETTYALRYFQFDGTGELRYNDEDPFKPNDIYDLSDKRFRLYYTSQSNVTQTFDVWIKDSFGKEKQLSFQFNSKD